MLSYLNIGKNTNDGTGWPDLTHLADTLTDLRVDWLTEHTLPDLSNLTQLQLLSAVSSDITYLPYNLTETNPNLANIIIDTTNLHCDCALLWLKEAASFDLSASGVTCVTPPTLSGGAWSDVTGDDLCPTSLVSDETTAESVAFTTVHTTLVEATTDRVQQRTTAEGNDLLIH